MGIGHMQSVMDDTLIQAGKDSLGQGGICFRRADVPSPVKTDQEPSHKVLIHNQAGIYGQAATGTTQGLVRQSEKAADLMFVQVMKHAHSQDQIEARETGIRDVFYRQTVKLSSGAIFFFSCTDILWAEINAHIANVMGQIFKNGSMPAAQVQNAAFRGCTDMVLDQSAVQPRRA